MTVRVPIAGAPGKVAQVNPRATEGAVLGQNLRWPDGRLVTPEDLSAPAQTGGTPLERLVPQISKNADAAQAAADAAQADATASLAELSDLAADGKLTAPEKLPARREYDELTGEYAGIDAQAAGYGITTERTNYTDAVNALKAYLRDTVQVLDANYVWTSVTGTTDIARATWDSTWRQVYSTRQALLNKIVERAKAIGDAAQETANSRNRVFDGATEPTGAVTGDLWRDTPNRVLKRWSGTAWEFYAADTVSKNLIVNPTGQHDFDGWTGWIGSGRQRMTTRNEGFGRAFACDFSDASGTFDMGASQEIAPVSGSSAYTLSLGIYGFHMGSGSVHAQIRFYASSGAQTGASVNIEADITGNALESRFVTMTSPADAVKAAIIIRATGTSQVGVGGFFRWWNLKFEASSFPTPYTDDATPKVSPLDNYLDPSVGGAGRWRSGLRFGISGHRLGDERNLRALAGWNRTNGAAAVSLSATDAGTTATISIPSHSRFAGFGTTSFASASITGLAFSTYYLIYRDTPNYNSSEGAYTASTDVYAGLKHSDRCVIGGITTPADGGASTGGSGADCVSADAWVRAGVRARDVRRFMLLDVLRPRRWYWRLLWRVLGRKLPVRRAPRRVEQPGVLVETEGGAQLPCSHSTPFDLPGGRVAYAPFLLGERVHTDRGLERVVAVRDLGRIDVVRISVYGHSFAAGADPAHRIFSHNAEKP
jgi:hypothetical protein